MQTNGDTEHRDRYIYLSQNIVFKGQQSLNYLPIGTLTHNSDPRRYPRDWLANQHSSTNF